MAKKETKETVQTPQSCYELALLTGKRNKKLEPLIATSDRWSYHYAKDFLNARFELGEAAIATNAALSYYYALNVIKGRFELGEVAIAKDTQSAYFYACHVLKKKFELGEESIHKDEYWSHQYNLRFNTKRKREPKPKPVLPIAENVLIEENIVDVVEETASVEVLEMAEVT